MADFRDETLELLRRYLFSDEEDLQAAGLRTDTLERLMNVREMYYYWLRNPQLTDQVVAAQFRQRYGYAHSNAYILTNYLKILIGDTTKVTRAWYQHVFLQRCEEAFAMARANNDAKNSNNITNIDSTRNIRENRLNGTNSFSTRTCRTVSETSHH